jgi:putative addiction module component (TIGR02574 family)
MSTTALKICVEVLSLPREARAEIAHRLLVSLEDEKPDARAEAAWKSEIRRRRRQVRLGKTRLIPAEEVMRKALRAVT